MENNVDKCRLDRKIVRKGEEWEEHYKAWKRKWRKHKGGEKEKMRLERQKKTGVLEKQRKE